MTDRENCLATLKVARKKAVDCVGNYKFYLVIGQALDFAINDIKKRGSEAPAVDAVEVVRCRNCKHCEDGLCYHPRSNGLTDVLMVLDDDFCRYGEPKTVT